MRLGAGAALSLLVAAAVIAALVTGELSFLENSTSWQLGFSVLPQTPSDPYWKTMGLAVLNTVVLAGVAIVAATVLGAAFAFLSIAGNRAWSRLAGAYVQFFRNMPLILQALFWFAVLSHLPGPRQALQMLGIVVSNRGASVPFLTLVGLAMVCAALAALVAVGWALRKSAASRRGRMLIPLLAALLCAMAVSRLGFPDEAIWTVPELTGFNFTGGAHLPTELLSVLIALMMFGSAYIAEIIRGGFATVPKGLIEAAHALALPAWVVEAKVRVPLALRAIILPLGSQFTTLIKASSIGLAVGFTDLFAVTLMSINQSGHTVALLCVMTACFVFLNQAVVSSANALNRAFQLPGSRLDS